jgi:peptide-methionine (R)-S-oxide reductase
MRKYDKNPDAIANLSPEQYRVTQENGTERPGTGEYLDKKEPGIYVDIVSGEPLFSSLEIFDSGTGWPSFWQPLEPANVKQSSNLGGILGSYAEVRSAHANSHLGHVFTDGPRPTGLRYCMNSAAMYFIPAEDLEKAGYGQYAALFQNKP